jgi:hypothetical protein
MIAEGERSTRSFGSLASGREFAEIPGEPRAFVSRTRPVMQRIVVGAKSRISQHRAMGGSSRDRPIGSAAIRKRRPFKGLFCWPRYLNGRDACLRSRPRRLGGLREQDGAGSREARFFALPPITVSSASTTLAVAYPNRATEIAPLISGKCTRWTRNSTSREAEAAIGVSHGVHATATGARSSASSSAVRATAAS